jgi:hypothetical protein
VAIDINSKPKKVKICSGDTQQLEDQLNAYGDSYSPLIWNFAVVGDRVIGTVVMLHSSVIGQMQIAQATAQGFGGRR